MGAKKGSKPAKKVMKKGGGKKKVVDTFTRKEWYDVQAPAAFTVRNFGKTIVNKSTGNKLAADYLRGRVFEVSQGDLVPASQEEGYRIFKLRVEDIQGKLCLTNFYGMRLSTDKLRSIPRKWHTLIEAHTDLKTAEGFVFRVFALAITKKSPNQLKKTAYAQSSQVRAIRKRMIDVLEKEISGKDFNYIITQLTSQTIGKEIEKSCGSIYPLQSAVVSKIKTLRAPKTDLSKLMELHGGANAVANAALSSGQMVERDDDVEMDQQAAGKGKMPTVDSTA